MRLIICFLFFFVLNSSIAQDKKTITEEEYIVLKYKIRLHYNSNIDSSLVYAYQMAKSDNNKHLAFANGVMSNLLQIKGKIELSKEKYKKAFYYLEKMPDSRDKIELKSDIYNFGGLGDWVSKNYGAAIKKFQQGIKLSKQINDVNQIIKLKANIALVNESVGNYQLAINNAREINDFLHENKDLFSKDEFLRRKSNINFSLGSSYEGYFVANHSKRYLLDSAEYFYKKCIDYSSNLISNKNASKLSLGNIYNFKNDYKNAEKLYKEVVVLAQQNNQKSLLCNVIFNLGNVYYKTKRYNKALLYFKKSDSISRLTNVNGESFLRSNFHLSKIYTILNKPELAYKYSKIYLESKEKYESKLNKETLEANYLQGIDNLTKEMISVEENYKKEVLLYKVEKVFYSILLLAVIALLVKNISDKNQANKKMFALIQEFKANIGKKNQPRSKAVWAESDKNLLKKESLTIDLIKENEIVEKLLELESSQEYLNADFTLIYVAKRIQTNTTYLSYVVNKRFGKSFGEYTNELKINYVINEMITNEIYRKNSTQIIAESVGFKNAGSFAKSFRKRTGVSPVQFANNI